MSNENDWIIPRDTLNEESAKQLQKYFEYLINKAIKISAATGLDIQHVLENIDKFDER